MLSKCFRIEFLVAFYETCTSTERLSTNRYYCYMSHKLHNPSDCQTQMIMRTTNRAPVSVCWCCASVACVNICPTICACVQHAEKKCQPPWRNTRVKVISIHTAPNSVENLAGQPELRLSWNYGMQPLRGSYLAVCSARTSGFASWHHGGGMLVVCVCSASKTKFHCLFTREPHRLEVER